jgi:molybdenum cofactor cytidylyltransferase
MKSGDNIAAIILAAGLSSRLGAFKPLLTLRGRLIIEVVINLFREAEISDIVVVVGYEAERIIPILKKQGARWVINEHYKERCCPPSKLESRNSPMTAGHFSSALAIMPLIPPVTLKKMVAAYREGGYGRLSSLSRAKAGSSAPHLRRR